jgi:hypothetical protein
MKIEYSKQAAKAIGKINIPEDQPTFEEVEAIRIGREEIRSGETISHDDIVWD